MRPISLAIAFLLFVLCLGSAEAGTRALIVGVSGYPNLADSLRLTGPKNDSREVANTLARLGIPAADITVLADGVDNLSHGIVNEGPATKAAVLGKLSRLADISQPGDLVVFYFSGHGSQQPDRNGDEGGSADEIILPYDVGKWNGSEVDRAIADDELNGPIERMLARGVDFFGIIDACFSATGFRAFPGEEIRERMIDPNELGIPYLEPATEGSLLASDIPRALSDRGRAAFFYAAQDSEAALEREPNGGNAGEFFGVFTFNLIKRLNQSPGITYRTLHQAVINDIKRGSLMATQTPELEGELLDEPVLRLSNATARRQWSIFAGKLQGGQLDGLEAGAILALYDDPTAPDEAALAHGVVEMAGATKSIVLPTEFRCLQRDNEGACSRRSQELAFKNARFARLVQPGVDFSLVLSEPIRIDPQDGYDYAPALVALESALKSGGLARRISIKSTGYEVAVALVNGKLAFATAAGKVGAPGSGSLASLTLPDNAAAAVETVAAALSRIARATALQRLGGDRAADTLGLRIALNVAKPRIIDVDGYCPRERINYAAAVLSSPPTKVAHCDILSVEMKNRGKKPLDVTILLIGRDFAITPIWPEAGESNRIAAGSSRLADLLQMEADDEIELEERLVFIAVPGVSRSHTAFTNLEQEGLRAAIDETLEITATRAAVDIGLNGIDRSSTSVPSRLEEEMLVEVHPFTISKIHRQR